MGVHKYVTKSSSILYAIFAKLFSLVALFYFHNLQITNSDQCGIKLIFIYPHTVFLF